MLFANIFLWDQLHWGFAMLDNFREWLSDNLRYVLLGLAVILVIIVCFCIFRLVGGASSSDKKQKETTAVTTAAADEKSSEKAVSVNVSAPDAGESLTRDDEKLLELAKKYYTAVHAEDEATLATMVEPWNDSVKEKTFALNDRFSSFENISTYSKDGPDEGTYLVYVYCEDKVDGVDSGIPSLLNPLIVITTDSSDLKISSDTSAYADFIAESNASDDVQSLIAQVNKQYDELKSSNSQVSDYSNGGSANTGEASTEAEGSAGTSQTTYGTATATDGVNVRSEGSTNGAVLGSLYPGQEVNIVSSDGDWTHITYQDPSSGATIDGYVSSAYLNIG